MDKYHVNPVTGNVSQCRARWECPFGPAEAHFDNASDARAMFEQTQDLFPKRMKKAKVFRIGPLEPRKQHFDELQEVLNDFEETTPEGRVGRAQGLFASPDIQSHGRWVLGIGDISKEDITSREFSVDPNAVYVYPVELYEIASDAQRNKSREEFLAAAKEYWDSGMTLAQWHAWSERVKPEPGTWEVIVPPELVENPRPVSNKRIIENATENWHSQLGWFLERRRAAKGLTWPRKVELLEKANHVSHQS